jgi:hypothetical protein
MCARVYTLALYLRKGIQTKYETKNQSMQTHSQLVIAKMNLQHPMKPPNFTMTTLSFVQIYADACVFS